MKSSLYIGKVRHRRYSPRGHEFNYQVAMFLVDLSEAERLFDTPLLFSKSRALLQFRRSDYYGDSKRPIADCIGELVEARTGEKILGPIRLLTQIRYLGVCFNPVSFYYCYDETGEKLKFIVSEITNTPWNQRHVYVLKCEDQAGSQNFRFEKDFHVSPFLPMEMDYSWNFSRPAKTLTVHMENYLRDSSKPAFDATMTLEQRPLTFGSVVGVIVSFPLLTIKTILAIYWQALLLKLKGVPFHQHPESIRRTKI